MEYKTQDAQGTQYGVVVAVTSQALVRIENCSLAGEDEVLTQ